MLARWLHPVYLLALVLLLLNDFWWKAAFGNAFTGKLSDFAGVVAFAWFWATLLPRYAKASFLLTGIGFIWWKSPLATPFILWLQGLHLPVSRVIDPSDLWALIMLPLAYWIWQHPFHLSKRWRPQWSVLLVATISLFAFSATTLIRHNTVMPPGDLALDRHYEIKLSPEQIIAYLEEEGIAVEKMPDQLDTLDYYSWNQPQYRIPEYITYYQDTVRNIHFSMREYEPQKTHFRLINLTLVKEYNLQSWETMKDLHRIYRRHFKHHLIKPMRKSRKH